jgi:hypothetical protein
LPPGGFIALAIWLWRSGCDVLDVPTLAGLMEAARNFQKAMIVRAGSDDAWFGKNGRAGGPESLRRGFVRITL